MAEARPARQPTTINGVPLDGSAPVPRGFILSTAAVGLPMLLGGGWLGLDDLRFLLRAESVPGRVVRIVEVVDRQRLPLHETWAPELVFTPADGAERRLVSPDARREPCCSVGETVTVRFPPGVPESARVVTFTQDFALPAFLAGFGLFWTWLSLLLLRAHWRHRRRSTRQPSN